MVVTARSSPQRASDQHLLLLNRNHTSKELFEKPASLLFSKGKKHKFVSLTKVTYVLTIAFLVVFILWIMHDTQNLDSITQHAVVSTKKEPVEVSMSTLLALKESHSFFDDINDKNWMLLKERFQKTQPNYDTNLKQFERHSRYPNYFWANNWEPEFTCPHEIRLGKLGDGGKWICDPHRIGERVANNNECIVYSVGSNGNFEFEKEVKRVASQNCKIHTFDIKSEGRHKVFADEAIKANSTFHHIGIGSKKQATEGSVFKTFRQIFKMLGHEKKVIEILKIDVEGGEWENYKDWIEDWKKSGVVVRQFLLELHNARYPYCREIFDDLRNAGFVIFHKEANYLGNANSVEIAWIQLDKKFQTIEVL